MEKKKLAYLAAGTLTVIILIVLAIILSGQSMRTDSSITAVLNDLPLAENPENT